MNYAERIFKGSTIVFLSTLTAAVIGYLLRLYLARSLSITEFGLLYSILAFVGLFSLFKDLGLGQTLVKFLAEFSGTGGTKNIKPSIITVGSIQAAAAFVLMVPIIIFSGALAISYFKIAEAALPVQLIAVSFIIGTVMTTLQHSAQGLGHIKTYALVEPLRICTVFILSFFLIYMGATGISLAYVTGAGVAVIFLLAGLKAKKSVTGTSLYNRALTKKLIKFGLPVFVGGLSSLLLFYTDTIALTIFRGVGDVGLYQAAMPTSQMPWVMVNSLVVILLPIVSEMWAKNKKTEAAATIGLAAKISFVAVVPFALIFSIFSADIIGVLFGVEYVPATVALQILSISSIFYTLYVIFSTSLISINRPLTNTKITAFISLLNLALNIIFIPQYGIVAAASSTAISYFLGTILAFAALRKTASVNIGAFPLAKTTAGGAISILLIFACKSALSASLFLEIAASLALGLSVYFIFILRAKVLTKDDIRAFSRMRMPLPRAIIKIALKLSS